jgi:hypothetical protein
VAVPAGIDEACSRVDQQAEAAQTALPIESGDDIVREPDPLKRRAEHELTGVEDEWPLVVDLDELGQVVLRLLDVDEGVARVVEDAEEAVHPHVDARRLEQLAVIRLDLDPALVEQPRDRSVRQDHGAILVVLSGGTG